VVFLVKQKLIRGKRNKKRSIKRALSDTQGYQQNTINIQVCKGKKEKLDEGVENWEP